MNTGCFKCDKAQWDADGCTCEITGLLVGNTERGCEYRKDTELKPCPFCGGEAVMTYSKNGFQVFCDNDDCILNLLEMIDKTTEHEAAEAWNRRVENDT